MVDAITSFVVDQIGTYLIGEVSMLVGVKDDLEELRTELTFMHSYLKDVEAREKEDGVSKELTKLVLDIAYDVEDVLDTCFLKLEKRSQRRGLMRFANKIGKKKDTYSIGGDIQILKRRILDITRKRETYGISSSNQVQKRESSSSQRVRQLRRTRSIDEEAHVVGLEEDARLLLKKLVDDSENTRFMISIFGMGGLGKTVLARKLYNSEEVKGRYEYRAWTYVSQEYKTGDILMRIIRSLGVASDEELEKMRKFGEEELEVYLYNLLKGKRYLVVVDDIWEREAWESLKRALPCNRGDGGSRVIITTRIRAVAEGLGERVYAHMLRFLTFEESWKLFEQRAFKNTQWVDEDTRKMGKEMVQKCNGLPLAIVVLASLLSRKTPREWSDICASLWKRVKDDSIHISTVFDLSFKALTHELKLCFLYLSIFPEDYEFKVEKLIHLIVAEGFVQEDEEMMMEDTARHYIEELIDRSLVKAERIERGIVMSCRMHDLLRDVAIKKARELNFVHIYNTEHPSSTNCRREVVHNLTVDDYLCDRCVNEGMRSFLFLGARKGVMLDSYVETLTLKLKLLRVLNLEGLQFVRNGNIPMTSLPEVIGELIHLRYLGIADTGTKYLPALLSNLQLLQTLDASGNMFEVTTDLSKLRSLRHLMGKFVGELILGEAVNLQTLRSISSNSWSKLKHELLVNLRYLEISDGRVPLSLLKHVQASVDFASFSKLKNLRVRKVETEKAFGFMGVEFPSLESLTFFGSSLQQDPMPALQKLPRLEDLVLYNCYWQPDTMSISAQGFGRLRKLELKMEGLNELHIEEEAMPSLIKLYLETHARPRKVMIPGRLRAIAKASGSNFSWYYGSTNV